MADVHSKDTRSFNMSRIRSRDTKPETIVRQYLHREGLRFRLHHPDLPGKPDIVLPRFQTVVLVHGCFWHAHDDKPCFRLPSSRTEWWQRKLGYNKARDWQQQRELTMLGWRVIVVWECELKSSQRAETLKHLIQEILHPLDDSYD
ncbi:DNA mismatch endonuclease Vsr [Hymenobacter sp. BT683]|uniref:Very short patch repair endonuclease n=1 Tax=Hymenobacter jeongseonensis TaxID=2791027 RepID=A0ABS0IP05_9BACT|nr:DNA mismatch endonuclease Vsr [Hymenobacter jeongseonensis]MBF9239510.1 DNA mismatch endonuclease Vsr [Hymenobacter jeongseonensis]